MKPDAFFSATKPIMAECLDALIAQNISVAVPDFYQLIWAQMADETGWDARGCSRGYPSWRGQNNWSGLSWQGKLQNFASVSEYAQAWAKTMGQSQYAAVRAATTLAEAARALGESDWAMSHYMGQTGQPGGVLQQIIAQEGAVMQTVYIPQAASTITVQPGDTLSGIAAAHGDTLAAVEAANPQIPDPNVIQPGEVVHLPEPGAAVTVQPGETLSGIAAAHGETLAAVEAANPQIPDPNVIQPGQVVHLPNPDPNALVAQAATSLIGAGSLVTLEASGSKNGKPVYRIDHA